MLSANEAPSARAACKISSFHTVGAMAGDFGFDLLDGEAIGGLDRPGRALSTLRSRDGAHRGEARGRGEIIKAKELVRRCEIALKLEVLELREWDVHVLLTEGVRRGDAR